ncbi:hypothetical protein EDD15DRAFT_2534498 [Pisolithus albus]|nr:hypothetical protein EDD15DRAFT_2534498 [Pisolithus albus]
MTSSDASDVATHLDIEQAAVLRTPTGTLYNRVEQVSHFIKGKRYQRLASFCGTHDRHQQVELVRADVSRHFQYVTFSHRWGESEPSLRNIVGCTIYGMSIKGVSESCKPSVVWLWCWITCGHGGCIDKRSSAEVRETIGSMFAWYRQSALTIVYLSDVPDTGSLGCSEWFRRGWTLQGLLTPRSVLFYTEAWSLYKNLASSNHKTDVIVPEELEKESAGFSPAFLHS